MSEIVFRGWDRKAKKLYYRAYQKLLYVLLCEDDRGRNHGKGTPIKRCSHDDCDLMQSTHLEDCKGVEIFEGDRLRIHYQGKDYVGVLENIPDMYKSRRLHPMQELLDIHQIPKNARELEYEVIGNWYDEQG